MQFGSDQGARHPEALGSAALLWPAGRIDAEGEAVDSMHSRAGGSYHGITAACETPQGLVIVSKGSGRLLLDSTGDSG